MEYQTISRRKVFYLLVAYYFFLLLTISLDNFFGPRLHLSFSNNVSRKAPIIIILEYFIFVFILPRKLFNWRFEELNFNFNNISFALFIVVFGGVSLYLSNSLVTKIFIQRLSIDYSLFCFSVLLLSTILEEFTFREIIFKKLMQLFNSSNAVFLSVLLSSLLFSIVHLSRAVIENNTLVNVLKFMSGSFLFGVLASIIYYRTRNFMLIVVLHMFSNLGGEFVQPLHFLNLHFVSFSRILIVILTVLILIFNIAQQRKKILIYGAMSVFFILYSIDFSSGDTVVTYYSNGSKKSTLGKDSFMTIYDTSENIIAFGKYVNGEKVDNWIEYNSNGTIIWQGTYKENSSQ